MTAECHDPPEAVTHVDGEPLARPTDVLARRQRRSLGLCARCGEEVTRDDDYVRLYRRAWHLTCALDQEGSEQLTDA